MIDGDTATKITLDSLANVLPENSARVVYGTEELEFRKKIDADMVGIRAAHPDAVGHVVE